VNQLKHSVDQLKRSAFDEMRRWPINQLRRYVTESNMTALFNSTKCQEKNNRNACTVAARFTRETSISRKQTRTEIHRLRGHNMDINRHNIYRLITENAADLVHGDS